MLFLLSLFGCHREKPQSPFVKTPYYKKAEAFLYAQNDSAFYYFNKVVSAHKDSLQVAMAYNQMGVIQSEAGDYFGGQESLLASLTFLHKDDPRDRNCLASDYNELGLISFNLKDHSAAIAFYDSAAFYSDQIPLQMVIRGNKALAYRNKGDYSQALALYRETLSQTPKGTKEYARNLSNMALTKWLANPRYNAAPELLIALKIRQRESDSWGQNASYVHLTRYYTPLKTDSALFYAKKWYNVAIQIKSPDDQLEALPAMIRLSPQEKIKPYFNRYQQLTDSLQGARSAAKNQFALIRYDAEKNKADKLELQKDNREKRYQITKQKIFLGAFLFILIAGTAIAIILIKKKNQRTELEAQNRVRESQLMTSKKVHDVVANGLYRMMSELENQQQLDKEKLLDKIEFLYERSRDISYDSPQQDYKDFHVRIAELILAFATNDTKVVLVGNDDSFWEGTSPQVRNELEHILQELMVNMKKHSRASNVILKLEIGERARLVTYADDGAGSAKDLRKQNGLTNTGNRIQAIDGTLIFEENDGKGLRIRISFPLA